ncbi:hypothetical protein BG015_001088 [Linnemannia schmuckeri]|uniref:DUF21-domain-containing protein n=1 Tax=Linnemannia schmuckeri TaxID=64567 RepID=A0A9P5RQ82_9FUNG|nr:hypothetical protein BG015_001088 [Linnemannia schmuckeri]
MSYHSYQNDSGSQDVTVTIPAEKASAADINTNGLTIGLMGLDETNLHVLMASGSPKEQFHAETVFGLLSRGKHWVLVTLLLGNVIVNETLPVVLDSELGGGVVAILISTLLIVIFGEIIPQAVCARYGLAIGAYCAKPMLIFMYIMSPIAYPIAMLLDSWLGVHHGTTYRRTELKTLVSLHQVNGIGELTDDEVTIIASVLDLKEKPVSMVMTPLEDVFTLSEDAILDEELMEEIVSAGYSRIPIYRHDDPSNFIGMLLVKRLITYDPEDHIAVRQFKINSLPEAAPNTSCLDILNFFQEGRSHMAMVTSEPGGFGLPVGVITLEDVIEELLGEEIVDESDVYVDVHNKIRVIRKPAKNVHMIKNLKNLLQSPALSEAATPLMGPTALLTDHAGVVMHPSPQIERRLAVPVETPNQFMSGKTILQSRKTSVGGRGENQPLLNSDGAPHHCEFRTGSYPKYDHYTGPKSLQPPYTHHPQQHQHSTLALHVDSKPPPKTHTPRAPQLGNTVSIATGAPAPVHDLEPLTAPILTPTIDNNHLDSVSETSTPVVRPESTASTTVTETESPASSTGSKKKKKKKKSHK